MSLGSLLNPAMLHNILRNVIFHLHEGYELLVGTRAENVHFYYELVKAALIRDANCVKLIFNVPLKTANRYFTLYKVIAIPTRISDSNFAQFVPDFTYFGLDKIHSNYILLTEVDMNRCTDGKSPYVLQTKQYTAYR
jgi:hypothetical protein